VISGTHDLAATPAQGRELAESVPGARYVELDASHISNVELADAYTKTVVDFLLEAR
jgi:3-oxoadipate enol-lactonase